MMMTDLVVIKNVLELSIDKYLLIDAMTRNFGCLLVFSNFWISPAIAFMLLDFC